MATENFNLRGGKMKNEEDSFEVAYQLMFLEELQTTKDDFEILVHETN